MQLIIESKAKKYGPIEIVSEEDFIKEQTK